MTIVTLSDLKASGIADIERILQRDQEVVISVRGKPRYVVVDISHYAYLRECETAAAWWRSRADVAAGRFRSESAAKHLARIMSEPEDEP